VSQTALKLILVDRDPIFLLGLQTVCQACPAFEIVGEAQTARATLELLQNQNGDADLPDAIVADGDLLGDRLDADTADTLLDRLHRDFGRVPLLALSSRPPDRQTLEALGVRGSCPKGIPGSELIAAIREVAEGRSYWHPSLSGSASLAIAAHRGGLLGNLWQDFHRLGLHQIDRQLAEITTQLQHSSLPNVDRWFLEGRQRELIAARWMVDRILAPPAPSSAAMGERRPSPNRPTPATNAPQSAPPSAAGALTLSDPNHEALVEFVPASLFELTLAKIPQVKRNNTGRPMEIDILRPPKKQQLLAIVVGQLEAVLDQLRFSQVQLTQLGSKRSQILEDIWEGAIAEFFGQYYSLWIGEVPGAVQEVWLNGDNPYTVPQELRPTLAPETLGMREIELVPALLQDVAIVRRDILDRIPFVVDLCAYCLFKIPLAIDNRAHAWDSPAARERAQAILENLTIEIANAAIQPLLNQFADVEAIKQNFYERCWMPSREIERLRNDLSWQYRRQQYWQEPKDIFESQYRLFVLGATAIECQSVYASRTQELQQLQGLRLGATLLLETRDAIAPRLRALLVSIGNGARYLLIQIGRGIGLVGRGILQGIGNSLQETRYSKNREQSK